MQFVSFVNALYLSPIQWGIQSAHLVSDMFVKYKQPRFGAIDENKRAAEVKLHEWAEFHKTMIVLDGGPCGSLLELKPQLERFAEMFNLPTCTFHEDEFSLNGAITGCAIVRPEWAWKYKKVHNIDGDGVPVMSYSYLDVDSNRETFFHPGSEEHEFITFMNGFRLAGR